MRSNARGRRQAGLAGRRGLVDQRGEAGRRRLPRWRRGEPRRRHLTRWPLAGRRGEAGRRRLARWRHGGVQRESPAEIGVFVLCVCVCSFVCECVCVWINAKSLPALCCRSRTWRSWCTSAGEGVGAPCHHSGRRTIHLQETQKLKNHEDSQHKSKNWEDTRIDRHQIVIKQDQSTW